MGIEFIAQQQVIHRIAPTRPGDIAKVRAGQRRNAALRLHLAETAVIGRDDDVARQRHLDPNREDDALHRRDDGFSAFDLQPERVDIAFGSRDGLRPGTEKFWHVETCGEISAGGTENPHPEVVVPVKQRQGG